MFIFTALVSLISRQAGRVASTLFGWAIMMLFGKVPENKQMWLSAVALGSILWVALVLGIAFPSFGLFLLAFLPKPDFISDSVVRLVMLAGALILPVLIGAVSSLVLTEERRGGMDLVKGILRGYPTALALALTLAILVVYVPILKTSAIAKRWEEVHLPAMIKADAYDKVVTDMREALESVDLTLVRERAPLMLRLPPKILAGLGGGAIANMVAESLTRLRGDDEEVQVIVYPSDLLVRGKKEQVALARSTIVRQIGFSDAYMSWTKEGNDLEDRLRTIWREVRGNRDLHVGVRALRRLNEVQEDIDRSTVDYEEWEVLYREKMEFERQILQSVADADEAPEEPRDSKASAKGIAKTAERSVFSLRDLVAAVASLPAAAVPLAIAGAFLWLFNRLR